MHFAYLQRCTYILKRYVCVQLHVWFFVNTVFVVCIDVYVL